MQTKFKIHDEIHFMENNKPQSGKIKGISTYEGNIKALHFEREVVKDKILVCYHCGPYISVDEQNAFASKEELQKSLFAE